MHSACWKYARIIIRNASLQNCTLERPVCSYSRVQAQAFKVKNVTWKLHARQRWYGRLITLLFWGVSLCTSLLFTSENRSRERLDFGTLQALRSPGTVEHTGCKSWYNIEIPCMHPGFQAKTGRKSIQIVCFTEPQRIVQVLCEYLNYILVHSGAFTVVTLDIVIPSLSLCTGALGMQFHTGLIWGMKVLYGTWHYLYYSFPLRNGGLPRRLNQPEINTLSYEKWKFPIPILLQDS